MSQPEQVRSSDGIAGKLIEGGVPANGQTIQFNSATNQWEFVASVAGADKRVNLGMTGTEDTNLTSNGTDFPPLYSWRYDNLIAVATEANYQITIDWALTIKRILIRMETNTKNAATVIACRDDGVSVASISIAASTTGEFDTGDITVLILTGSLVNWLIDTSASVSGAIGDFVQMLWGFET